MNSSHVDKQTVREGKATTHETKSENKKRKSILFFNRVDTVFERKKKKLETFGQVVLSSFIDKESATFLLIKNAPRFIDKTVSLTRMK